jgi:hypothetical protein
MNIQKPGFAPVAVGLLIAACAPLAGCKSISSHMPWAHKAPPPPEVSTALVVAGLDGALLTWPQYWVRNDVVLDLSQVSGTGTALVTPRSGLAWPVRVALRVTRGSIGALDVHGAQRFVVPVPASGTGTVDLELPPGVYVAATKQLTVNWGPATAPAE